MVASYTRMTPVSSNASLEKRRRIDIAGAVYTLLGYIEELGLGYITHMKPLISYMDLWILAPVLNTIVIGESAYRWDCFAPLASAFAYDASKSTDSRRAPHGIPVSAGVLAADLAQRCDIEFNHAVSIYRDSWRLIDHGVLFVNAQIAEGARTADCAVISDMLRVVIKMMMTSYSTEARRVSIFTVGSKAQRLGVALEASVRGDRGITISKFHTEHPSSIYRGRKYGTPYYKVRLHSDTFSPNLWKSIRSFAGSSHYSMTTAPRLADRKAVKDYSLEYTNVVATNLYASGSSYVAVIRNCSADISLLKDQLDITHTAMAELSNSPGFDKSSPEGTAALAMLDHVRGIKDVVEALVASMDLVDQGTTAVLSRLQLHSVTPSAVMDTQARLSAGRGSRRAHTVPVNVLTAKPMSPVDGPSETPVVEITAGMQRLAYEDPPPPMPVITVSMPRTAQEAAATPIDRGTPFPKSQVLKAKVFVKSRLGKATRLIDALQSSIAAGSWSPDMLGQYKAVTEALKLRATEGKAVINVATPAEQDAFIAICGEA